MVQTSCQDLFATVWFMRASEFARHLGRRIGELRKAKGVTAERMAWESDLSKGFVSQLESGKRLPKLMPLVRIANTLGVQLKDFFDFGV